MAGLLSTLSSAASALNAQTAAINVTSNNIANENNPYYSEETAAVEDMGSVETAEGPVSIGMQINVTQARDALLDQMVQQQASLTSGYTAQQSILEDAQASLGEDLTDGSNSSSTSTTSESGLSSAIDSFFNAVESVAADPGDSSQVESLLQQAGVLTDRFQEVYSGLAGVQSDAETQIADDVTSANQLLAQVASLNTQIAAVSGDGSGAADSLIDQREGDLEKLAAYLPVTVTQQANGEDTLTTADNTGGTVTLVSGGTVANSLSCSGNTLSAGPTALGVTSGSIQGTIDAITGPVQTMMNSLNSLAAEIVTSVNAAYNPGNSPTGNFFLASGTSASSISVDPHLTASSLTAGTGASGDNSIAVAVGNVANRSFSTANGDAIDGTITGYYAGAVTTLGQELDTANTNVTDQTNVQTIVTNQRQSVSGVSVDEEMSNLMTYQSAYQASSEMLSIVSNLIGSLITDVSGT